MYYLSLNLRLQLKEKGKGWSGRKIKLSEILEETLLKLSWSIQSPHLETCATTKDVHSTSNKNSFEQHTSIYRTYCVRALCPLCSWRGQKHRQRVCKNDSLTLLHDVHHQSKRHANLSYFNRLHTCTLKSTVSAASTLHKMPMKEQLHHNDKWEWLQSFGLDLNILICC